MAKAKPETASPPKQTVGIRLEIPAEVYARMRHAAAQSAESLVAYSRRAVIESTNRDWPAETAQPETRKRK